MASSHDNLEKGQGDGGVESGSDDKMPSQHIDGKKSYIPDASSPPRRILEAPEFIRNMTDEERYRVESSLKRKIDMRLMPMIIIM